MDGYNTVIRITSERPGYLSIIKKCVEAHHREEKKQPPIGFRWHEVGVWPVKLALLATVHGLLKIMHKTNRAIYYMVQDIEGTEKALHDIEAKRVATPGGQGRALRVWLSNNTTQRLNTYLVKEFPDEPDAESIIVQRALNLFLDKEDDAKLKTRD